MIHQPVFQTPGCKNLKLLAESTGELATKSSVINDYMHYQNQLTDTLRAMTDHLAMLSVPPAPPAPSKLKSRVKPQNPTHLTVPTQASLTHSCSNTACTSFSAAKTSWMTPGGIHTFSPEGLCAWLVPECGHPWLIWLHVYYLVNLNLGIHQWTMPSFWPAQSCQWCHCPHRGLEIQECGQGCQVHSQLQLRHAMYQLEQQSTLPAIL